ncbi:hypothetical protein GCM10009747_29840 [Agromyces humatus]|uniref:Uncharacterized protein n=1 Tax=Agromyces humatus TaxID=279573 RepID=A0ABN2KVJ8_9MICO
MDITGMQPAEIAAIELCGGYACRHHNDHAVAVAVIEGPAGGRDTARRCNVRRRLVLMRRHNFVLDM